MPLYEGIGLISEKQAVVLDIGGAYTKVGYAGESHPRAIVQSPPDLFRTEDSEEELYDKFVDFIHSLYFEYLLVNPKDRRVVVLESIIGDARQRDVLAKVLFKHFEVLSILFAPSHLMPLFTLGIRTALVLDVGFREATLIPIYEGVPILKAWQALPLASHAVQEALKMELMKEAVSLSDEVIEDIMVRLCFVTNLDRGTKIQTIRADASSVAGLSSIVSKTAPGIDYPLGGNSILYVDGSVRESVCEVLFERDNDNMSVSTMVLDAVKTCPVDTRRQLAENIVFIGGMTLIPGFKSRIISELKELIKNHPKYQSLNIENFKIHVPPAKANFVAWAGASIFGATDAISTRSLLRDQYLKDGSVPDWADLRYNTTEALKTSRKG